MGLLDNLNNSQIASLSAGAGLAGNLINGVFGVYNNYKNRQFQQQANEQNIAFQREVNQQNIDEQWKMWDATNAYNHPAAQMGRYREAGLNPNLIYGQSNTVQANNVGTSSASRVEAKRNERIQLASDASMYMDLLMKAEDLHSKRIDNDVNGAIADDLKKQAGWNSRIMEREIEKLGIEIKRGNIDNAIREFDKILRHNDVSNISLNNRLLSNNVTLSDNSLSNIRILNSILNNEKLLSDYAVNEAEYNKKYKRGLEYQLLSEELKRSMEETKRIFRSNPISYNILKNQEKRSGYQASQAMFWSDLLGGASNIIPWILLLRGKGPKTIKGFGGKY